MNLATGIVSILLDDRKRNMYLYQGLLNCDSLDRINCQQSLHQVLGYQDLILTLLFLFHSFHFAYSIPSSDTPSQDELEKLYNPCLICSFIGGGERSSARYLHYVLKHFKEKQILQRETNR